MNKQDKLFTEICNQVREEKIIEKRYGLTEIPEGEPLFTTSQETDVWEMIRDGMEGDEIMENIRLW